MATPAKTVAKFIVQNSVEPVSNLKLQKLLYYVQGWHLGIHGKVVFPERIEAWAHGPVVPDVFFHYRHFRWTPIEVCSEKIQLDGGIEQHTREVLGAYGKFSAQQLEMLSHSETPWMKARGTLPPGAPSNAQISPASMREYFATLAHGSQST